MNVYHCNWSKSYGMGVYAEYDCIIVAETKNVALGLALEHYQNTDAINWDIDKIDTDKRNVLEICDRGN